MTDENYDVAKPGRDNDAALLTSISEKLDKHIETTIAYRTSEESDRRAIKRDIRCLHDGYEANKTVVDATIKDMNAKVDDINLALFAPDEKNKFEQQGLMTTARNVDKHITVMCNFAHGIWKAGKIIGSILGGIVLVVTVAKAIGVW